jgi:O-succinylbenzoic acid--CoA ligase
LQSRIQDWLAIDRSSLLPLWEQKQQDLAVRSHLVIATNDPDEFITDFLAGIVIGLPIFLASPGWGQAERQQLLAITVNGNHQQHRGQIMIPTGGTSGQLKFAMHTPATLTAAVQGFQEFYQVEAIDSYCILPLHHVSGLMQLWRSLITGGQLLLPSKQQHFSQSPPPHFFISLVPTQLQRLLPTKATWLRQFKAVLVGGASVWPDLIDMARLAQIPLSLRSEERRVGKECRSRWSPYH